MPVHDAPDLPPMPLGVKPLTPGVDEFPPVPEISSARARRGYEEVAQLEQTASEAQRKEHELKGRREAVRAADAQAEGKALRQGVEPPPREADKLEAEIKEAERQAAAWTQAKAQAQVELLELLREEADDLATKAEAKIEKALDRSLRKAVELQEELVALHRAYGDRLYASINAKYGDARLRTPAPILTEERGRNGDQLPAMSAAQSIADALVAAKEREEAD